jgi:tetrapyrrole methylase family protein/MazG family protein
MLCERKNMAQIDELKEVVRRLRAKDGCPWDMVQTHETLKPELIEEASEVLSGINVYLETGNGESLKEELGDLLLQIVFHASLAEDEGLFDFEDVCETVKDKMIVRHPHVFADTKVGGVDDVLTNWDSIKKETKGQKSDKEMLQSVSKAMPALMRNQKVQKKAGKLGVVLSASPKDELIAMLQEKDNFTMEEVGKLEALLVTVAAKSGADAEEALSKETDSFIESNF